MIKILNEVGIKRTYLNILMAKKKKRKKETLTEYWKSWSLQSDKKKKQKGGWDGKGGGRGVQDGNTCTPMAGSCQCMENHYNIVISFQLK